MEGIVIVKTSGRMVDGPTRNVTSFYIKIYIKPFVGPKLGPTIGVFFELIMVPTRGLRSVRAPAHFLQTSS